MRGLARALTLSVEGLLREITKPVIRLTTQEATTRNILSFIAIYGACGLARHAHRTFEGTFSAATLINETRSRTRTRHLILPSISAGGARRSEPERRARSNSTRA